MDRVVKNPHIKLFSFHGILSSAPEMERVFEQIRRLVHSDANILLRGETGTGKELFAGAIHKLSKRKQAPFYAINCATLSHDLLASELFGHKKGAFTGANTDKKGILEMAEGGTVFLDEIAEMPLDIQAQFLRLIQEKEFLPVGGTEKVKVDLRFLSATHQSLRMLVERKSFREDLMYRIRVIPIFIPPLTERTGDLEALLWHFIEELNQSSHRIVHSIEASAYEAIMEYPWPGNIRELKNNIEMAFALGEGDKILLSDLSPEVQGIAPQEYVAKGPTLPLSSEQEKQEILEALKKTHGKKAQAAEILGLSRTTLWRKIREYKL